MTEVKEKNAVTQNACKLCTPLGACLAIKGIKGAMPLLHGSQGCATYIRRYMISHFKEPIDIASSNFSEDTAIFGGGENLKLSIDNIRKQYNPLVIAIPTTCLSETIGDDVDMIIKEYMKEHNAEDLPYFVNISTPSYKGTHIDGFHETVLSVVQQFTDNKAIYNNKNIKQVNIFPGMVSAADIRYLKEITTDFEISYYMLPDYSDTLDGPLWSEYQKIPEGGTKIEQIKKMITSSASLEFGSIIKNKTSAAKVLHSNNKIPYFNIPLPIGINQTDKYFDILEKISGNNIPAKHNAERNRLIDSYADGHKHTFGVKAAIYGEEDLVVSLASFLSEIGIIPVLCASGGKSGYMEEEILNNISDQNLNEEIIVKDGCDFHEIENEIKNLNPDIIIGNSKGYSISRKLDIPLIRLGFPIHDRFGGQRILHLGYRGAQQLFDRIVNVIIEKKQSKSPIGYTYM